MLPNPLLRKLVQISDEALPPIHVPLILGNDCYILTQQDVRKIEDSRIFIMNKVLPNGGLKIINSLDPSNFQCQQILNSLVEFFNYKITSQECQQTVPQQPQQYSVHSEPSFPQPMEVSMTADAVASISQQLQWNKCTNTSAAFPIHYSRGTSTTEINCNHEKKDRAAMTDNNHEICPHCKNRIRYFDKSTNAPDIQIVCNKNSNEGLDARE